MIRTLVTALLLLPILLAAQTSLSSAPAKTNLAVMDLKAEGELGSTVGILSDRLRAELFNTGRFQVMERGEMDNILKEQGFQQSGACTDQACIVEAGQLLGVENIVAGSIGKLGQKYLINLRIVDVKSGKLIDTYSGECRCPIEELDASMKAAALTLAAKRGGTQQLPAASPAPLAMTPPPPAPAPAAAVAPAPDPAPVRPPQVPGGEPVPGSGNAIGFAFVFQGINPAANDLYRTLEDGGPGRLPLNPVESKPEFNDIQGFDLLYTRAIKSRLSVRLGIGYRSQSTDAPYSSPLPLRFQEIAAARGIALPWSGINTTADLETVPFNLGLVFHTLPSRVRFQAVLELVAVKSSLYMDFMGHWVNMDTITPPSIKPNPWTNVPVNSSVSFDNVGLGLSALVGMELKLTKHLALGLEGGFMTVNIAQVRGKGNLNDLDRALDRNHTPRLSQSEFEYKLVEFENPATRKTETLIVEKDLSTPAISDQAMSLKGPGFKTTLHYYF